MQIVISKESDVVKTADMGLKNNHTRSVFFGHILKCKVELWDFYLLKDGLSFKIFFLFKFCGSHKIKIL